MAPEAGPAGHAEIDRPRSDLVNLILALPGPPTGDSLGVEPNLTEFTAFNPPAQRAGRTGFPPRRCFLARGPVVARTEMTSNVKTVGILTAHPGKGNPIAQSGRRVDRLAGGTRQSTLRPLDRSVPARPLRDRRTLCRCNIRRLRIFSIISANVSAGRLHRAQAFDGCRRLRRRAEGGNSRRSAAKPIGRTWSVPDHNRAASAHLLQRIGDRVGRSCSTMALAAVGGRWDAR